MKNKIRNLWCFISISPSYLTHFKFSGASKLHDPTTKMKLVQIKDKEKLSRIIKNQPITHVTILFLFESFSKSYLWGKDIFAFYY